jgi:hypothetical protein
MLSRNQGKLFGDSTLSAYKKTKKDLEAQRLVVRAMVEPECQHAVTTSE